MLFRSNDTATTEIYTLWHTLSLHDALPIYIATVFGIDGMLGPRTKAYYRRLSSRPAFQRAAAVP